MDETTKLKELVLVLLEKHNGGLGYMGLVDRIQSGETNNIDFLHKLYCKKKNELNQIILEKFN